MWPAVAMGALGALTGSQADQGTSTSGRRLAPASAQEIAGGKASEAGLAQFQTQVGLGPGDTQVQQAQLSNKSLQDMLAKYSKGGYAPSESDISSAGKFAADMFAPQQLAMQQGYAGQQQKAAQLAAQMGRPINDPIIQSKLAQEQMQGQERLGAAQGAFASQYAQQQPMQRLGFTSQLADVNNSLASQAMANRQALFSMGNQVQTQQQNFRLNSAEQYGSTSSGGGLKGALTGGIAGFGAGAAIGNMFGGGAAAAGANSPMGQPNVGPQMPSGGGMNFSQAAPATSSFMGAFSGAQPQQSSAPYTGPLSPNYGMDQGQGPGMSSIMQGVGNPSFTPQFSGSDYFANFGTARGPVGPSKQY